MTRKDQIKILDDKIESNTNQYKADRLNAEISAFSSSNLNKLEFLTRKDLKYKPNALDKARFEFSPLGRAFNEGLDKTVANYQEEGIIKLLKDIRDGLRNSRNRSHDDDDYDNNDVDDDNLNNFINIKNKELKDALNREKELQRGMYDLRDIYTLENKKYKNKDKELQDALNREKELQRGIDSLKGLYNSNKKENDEIKNKSK